MEFFTYINKSLRNLRKLPIKHKEDRSTLVRVRKLLFKARYLNLIIPITSNLNLRGPDIREGEYIWLIMLYVLVLFIDFTDVFNYSLDSCFFLSICMSILFLLGYALLAGEPTFVTNRH